MARVKIDWTKVEMSGKVEAKDLVEALSPSIKELVIGGKVKTKLAKVAITVGEGDSAKMHGAAYLKVSDTDDSGIDALLATIKNAGKDVVIDAYNGIQRDSLLKTLQNDFGDVTAAINDAAKVLAESTGMNLEDARTFIVEKRKAQGKRVA